VPAAPSMKIFAKLFMVFRPNIDMEDRRFLADFALKGARPGSAPGAGVRRDRRSRSNRSGRPI
jgi:hypothetical protein